MTLSESFILFIECGLQNYIHDDELEELQHFEIYLFQYTSRRLKYVSKYKTRIGFVRIFRELKFVQSTNQIRELEIICIIYEINSWLKTTKNIRKMDSIFRNTSIYQTIFLHLATTAYT